MWMVSCFALTLACEPAIPEVPTIELNRTKLGFDQEFNSGTFIGTTKFNNVEIRNIGVQDLIIESSALTGNRFTKQGPPLTTLGYNDVTAIEVAFTPNAAQHYTGTLTITTNAANGATQTVQLSGCGVDPVVNDLSYCEKEDDFPPSTTD
jgi:hypothetical protein